MLDLKEECSVSDDQSMVFNPSSSSTTTTSQDSSDLKRCTDCQTTTTPLWRGGPAGPKTLCNACGIKYHKKRRALLGIDKGKVEKSKKKNNRNLGIPLKIKVMSSGIRRRDNTLGEVEQAAMLLMALSYSSVYA